MSTSKDTTALVLLEYDAILGMIEEEKRINISLVAKVIQKLITDTKNNPFAQEDEEGNATYKSSLRRKLKTIVAFFDNRSISCEGTNDDFHNLAVDIARQEMHYEACIILERGISIRPSAVDLLSDYILYGRNVPENRERCKQYFNILMDLPRSKWNWRAYSFSINHLLEERYYVSSLEEEEKIKEEAINIAKAFIKQYNDKRSDHEYIDRAYSDLASVYSAFGDYKKENMILKTCVSRYSRVPITSMHLAELEYSSGNYAEATQYLSNCIGTIGPQASVNQGYPFLLRAHSNASILFNNEKHKELGESPDTRNNLIMSINRDLDTAEDLIDNETYLTSIKILRTIIEKQCVMDDTLAEDNWG